ncbi:polysaccharide export outer membrane protein [Microbulbifer donghaiensis]|uniref:Polysaccharide export outer membrane protein n=1 Tax=Microbulbifer donghaiensis TaxID=494016 RepID=A0A1M4ZZP2_9GAMM|nr:polysaccharide biosynthesis/export family protein [Microbulbifer donghaiensis]SHF23106.1 polysaccharide export outer membrane protein [Microbulbifer donghaiensis]
MKMEFSWAHRVLKKVAPILFIFVLPLASENAFSSEQASSGKYKLGTGDKINILVYGEDDLTVETTLSESGVINYPFLGEINANNLTIGQLEALITKGLKGDYLINPVVRVSINEYRPFFIDGEVKVPGGYPYQPGLTISKAAALAQGFTERASKEKIFVIRDQGKKQNKFKADLNTELLPGDIVTVEQGFF